MFGRRQQYDQVGLFAPEYELPKYLPDAAYRKCGPGIIIIGATESDIKDFWRNLKVKASKGFGYQDEPPQEVTRQVVDITAKEHVNYGTFEEDEIEVVNDEEETKTQHKSYSLSFEKSWEFSGNIDVGASFFNALGVGGASLGLGGSISRRKKTHQDSTREEERSLSQQYSLTGKIKVPPTLSWSWQSQHMQSIIRWIWMPRLPVLFQMCSHSTTSQVWVSIAVEDLVQHVENRGLLMLKICFKMKMDLMSKEALLNLAEKQNLAILQKS